MSGTKLMEPLDLSPYLDRIGWSGGAPAANLGTLVELQLRHVAGIPFENLDVQMGIPIRLDLASLQRKLVLRKRGGYCFEKNSLLAAVLVRLGFPVALREGRVRRGGSLPWMPRTHLALQVDLEEGSFLVDGGFGCDGPLGPVPLSGTGVTHHGERNRVVDEGGLQVLQVLRGEEWLDLYALEPRPVHPVDLEMANHYTSTYPESRFVQTLTAQLRTPGGRWNLRNLDLTVQDARGERVESIPEPELLRVLRDVFGLEVPEGTRFRFQAP